MGRHGRPVRRLISKATLEQPARDLWLSLQTVKSHVASILLKLGARDRTQAVIAAYESGFILPGAHEKRSAGQ
ncbi:response regulator transcription factor [Luedemannella flava]|uniref:response regulator transcription factor n=1 Tax=Luedemannella flava TaxID=349316 RepID=UPI0036230124